MSPNRNPTSPSPPPSYTPWSPPPSPTTTLRKSFRSFCAAENIRRTQRGEAPFCTPDGRDRAFAKLMRLSRGEDDYVWDGAGWVDEVEAWYEEESMRMEEHREREMETERTEETDGREEKKVKLHERKDSKEVDGEKQDTWGSVARGLGMHGVRLSGDERVEFRENMNSGRK